MVRYFSSIKDLVAEAMTKESQIKNETKQNNPRACFKMGMFFLLGINRPINYKVAASFLGNESLADNPDANRLLGLIAELAGDYSLALKNYANAAGAIEKKENISYFSIAFEQRDELKKFLKEQNLPTNSFNEELSAVYEDYKNGGKSKMESLFKFALICNDEQSHFEAANAQYDAGNIYIAMRCLQRANIDQNNLLYSRIKEEQFKTRNILKQSSTIEPINIEGNSLIANTESLITSFSNIRQICDEKAQILKDLWEKKVREITSQYVQEELIKKHEKSEERNTITYFIFAAILFFLLRTIIGLGFLVSVFITLFIVGITIGIIAAFKSEFTD